MRPDETPLGAPLVALAGAQETGEGGGQLGRGAVRRQVAHELERDVAKRRAEVFRVPGDLPFEARAGVAPAHGRDEPARLGERGLVHGELVRVEARAEREEARLGGACPLVREEGARMLGPKREGRAVERPAALRRGARETREVPRRQEHGREVRARGQPGHALAVPVLFARAAPRRRTRASRRFAGPRRRRAAAPRRPRGREVLPRLGEVARAERRPARNERERLEEVRLPLPVVPDDEVQARVHLHLAVQEVSEAFGGERKNLHAADYILIGITT